MNWRKLKPLAMLGLILVIAQIALGGWTSSNYAALACPDLPTCQGRWLPPTDFAAGFNITQEIGPNYLGGQLDGAARVAIHMAHRIGAIVVTLYLIFLLSQLYKHPIARLPFHRRWEVEVHLVDLGIGPTPDGWTQQLVDRVLPWLIAGLRDRADDRSLMAWMLGRSSPPILDPWR
jgi:heme A synthase